MKNICNVEMTETAQLAYDVILQKPVRGIPSWLINPMEHSVIERLAGAPEGAYRRNPEPVYLAMQHNIGTGMLDQFIPENPLSIGAHGYDAATPPGATTGAAAVVIDGLTIDSPEAVAEHLERCVFPKLRQEIREFNADKHTAQIVANERKIQHTLGPSILKGGYGYAAFPGLPYHAYGYANYFMAYTLFPDVMEKHFALQADLDLLINRAAARACREAGLAPIIRLDHDIADSRGTLMDIRSLDRIWFPHFARCLEPLLKTDMRLIWHCDGNLMQMVPRLLEVGLRGFQGFQYEDGMDYEKICRMRDREGRDLVIIAGASVTRTLPFGTATDVKRELEFLMARGPRTGLLLGASSSIAPGVSWENMQTLVEGFAFYRKHGRDN